MITLLVSIGVFLLLIVGFLLLAMVVFKQAKTDVPSVSKKQITLIKLDYKYVLLPLVILMLTLVMVTIITPRLPAEVGYNFDDNGDPTTFMARGQLVVSTILPQLLLTGLAIFIGWGVVKLGNIFRSIQEGPISLTALLAVMGNIIGLPQLIIALVMANIFTYNAYHLNLPPLWIIILIVMGLSGVALGTYFTNMIRKTGSINLKDK